MNGGGFDPPGRLSAPVGVERRGYTRFMIFQHTKLSQSQIATIAELRQREARFNDYADLVVALTFHLFSKDYFANNWAHIEDFEVVEDFIDYCFTPPLEVSRRFLGLEEK